MVATHDWEEEVGRRFRLLRARDFIATINFVQLIKQIFHGVVEVEPDNLANVRVMNGNSFLPCPLPTLSILSLPSRDPALYCVVDNKKFAVSVPKFCLPWRLDSILTINLTIFRVGKGLGLGVGRPLGRDSSTLEYCKYALGQVLPFVYGLCWLFKPLYSW